MQFQNSRFTNGKIYTPVSVVLVASHSPTLVLSSSCDKSDVVSNSYILEGKNYCFKLNVIKARDIVSNRDILYT